LPRAAPRCASTWCRCLSTATDGFGEAFYARPEAFLRPEVRAATSGFLLTDPGAVQRGLERLQDDLASGAWDQAYGRLREQAEHNGALRLITAST